MTFEVGGKTIEASAGDFVFGPRDIPHRYKVGDASSRMLFILTPGGFEDLVRATSEPARSRTLPPADEAMPDEEQMMAAQAAAGCERMAERTVGTPAATLLVIAAAQSDSRAGLDRRPKQ